MAAMVTRFRADHVGSLLRPAVLLEARTTYAEGRLELDALRQTEDRAVLEAIRLQRDVGLEIFTDGEYRRGSWLTDLADAVEGFVPDHVFLEWHGPDGGTEASTARVVGARLRQTRRLTAHEVVLLKAHAPGPIKMTVPCPSHPRSTPPRDYGHHPSRGRGVARRRCSLCAVGCPVLRPLPRRYCPGA